jgi:predicted anti-sigma-YlaC factor YlaD
VSEEREETATTAGPAPIDDGWEPEPERPGLSSRFGDGPVEYFRAVPARGFAWLGTLVFVGGWAVAIYIAWIADDRGALSSVGTSYKLQTMTSLGLQASLAAGVLWAVAAFLWVRVLPATEGEMGA